ncbi:hypothetical protein Vretifemale_7531 [Volvox reticuliferus]|nr:hypothetical protein Vretifemale_7531 [Volvox reticuliferus]
MPYYMLYSFVVCRSMPYTYVFFSGNPVDSGAVKENIISGSSTTAVDLEAVRSAMQFIVTPLFSYSMADSQGRAAFNFTAPQNLGAFVIRYGYSRYEGPYVAWRGLTGKVWVNVYGIQCVRHRSHCNPLHSAF